MPTKLNLEKLFRLYPSLCPFCNNSGESEAHLFRDCPSSNIILKQVCNWWNIYHRSFVHFLLGDLEGEEWLCRVVSGSCGGVEFFCALADAPDYPFPDNHRSKMAGIVELLPKEFGYVVLTVIAYCFLNIFMQIQVGRARKRYNVPYPILYATEADSKDYKIFNCIQRGHQNSLETLPIFFTLLVLGGIRFPITCSVLGVVYTVSRFFYFTGYSSGDPKGRLPLGYVNFLLDLIRLCLAK
ncbi:hypothetical protein OSB04_000698 [Centaurea solstitialis]|uniref:Glutathione S-transferase 3, mitochondrial n=1 Tax=Centaurea solstitialis TaxID=347529 RepID=A0AA38U7Y2_9ASTR|nr:hypothetical protein OSB04_000698 [Centaurea solstitialis]